MLYWDVSICPSCKSPFSSVDSASICPACEKAKSTGTLVAFLVSLIPFFASLSIGSNRTTTMNGVVQSTSSRTDYLAVGVGATAVFLGVRALLRARKVKRPKTAKMAGVAIVLGMFHFIVGMLF